MFLVLVASAALASALVPVVAFFVALVVLLALTDDVAAFLAPAARRLGRSGQRGRSHGERGDGDEDKTGHGFHYSSASLPEISTALTGEASPFFSGSGNAIRV